MDVNSVSNSEEVQRLLQTQQSSSQQSSEMPPPPPGGFPGDNVSLSELGSLFNSMSEEGKSEMMSFREEMMESLKNGTFDAAAMAENAPDELKALAAEQGIDLQSALEDDAAMFEEMKDRFGGQPPMGPPPNGAGIDSGEAGDVLADEDENGIPDILEQSSEDEED